MAFPSVYEMTNPLTTVRKQHFWEYFSGATLNSRWTQGTISGSPSFSMTDSGFTLDCNAGGEQGFIDFNDKRNFSHNASEMIFVMKREGTSCVGYGGLYYDFNTPAVEQANWTNDTRDTYTVLETADASTRTSMDTTTAIHANFATGRISCGTSNIKLYEDGILTATKTTNRPTTRLQPTLTNVALTSSSQKVHFKYCEVYNT